VSFNVSADSYLRFMGRYSEPLAAQFADLAGVRDGQRLLDVGCGPGALTAELVSQAGPEAVSAVEPSGSFAAAARERLPGVDIRQAGAERLPFGDAAFDAALAQLVVHFMADPVAGLREMGRVTRPGGVVAACVWDHAGGRGPLSAFWRAVRELDPGADDESNLAGVREGHLAELFAQAGLGAAQVTTLTVRVRQPGFESWWETFTLGVGPAGAYLTSLPADRRDELRERCRRQLPVGPFEVSATAWAATARKKLEASPPGPDSRSTALPITACSSAAQAASRAPSRRPSSSTHSRTRSSKASTFTSPVTTGAIAASHAMPSAAAPSSQAPSPAPVSDAFARCPAHCARTWAVHSSCKAELPSRRSRSTSEMCTHALTGCPARSGTRFAAISRPMR
jgi:SAM-dependent methyltransferase